MTKDVFAISFQACPWQQIQPLATAHLREKQVVVESYWEDRVLAAHHYQMLDGAKPMGYFSIHGESTLVLFFVEPSYGALSQALFARVKKYESVVNALLPTGDEFFLCHCLDDYARLEKQGYLAVYGEAEAETSPVKQKRTPAPITLRQAQFPADTPTFALAQGFFDEDLPRLLAGSTSLTLYIAEQKGDVVGFGALQPSQILPETAGIGMYVCEEYRQQGVATVILTQLRQRVVDSGRKPVSGCWYYNHNSKKSLEAAGACCASRLLLFAF